MTQLSEGEVTQPSPPTARTQGAAAEVLGDDIMMHSLLQPTLAGMGYQWKQNVASALALKMAKDIQERNWQAKNKSEARIPKKRKKLVEEVDSGKGGGSAHVPDRSVDKVCLQSLSAI